MGTEWVKSRSLDLTLDPENLPIYYAWGTVYVKYSCNVMICDPTYQNGSGGSKVENSTFVIS